MRFAEGLLIVALSIGLAGCARKPKTVNAAPPAPTPAPASPAPPPEPLSIPQTNVTLPPPQPLSPEAIKTTQLPGEPASPSTPPPKTIPIGPRRPPSRPTEAPPIPTPSPATAPPAAPPDRGPLTEVLPAAEQKRLQDETAQRSQEARKLIEQLPARRRQQDIRVKRIETFLRQAADAERRGDVRQASELAGRALVLARELKP
jgi:hypothetical protein